MECTAPLNLGNYYDNVLQMGVENYSSIKAMHHSFQIPCSLYFSLDFSLSKIDESVVIIIKDKTVNIPIIAIELSFKCFIFIFCHNVKKLPQMKDWIKFLKLLVKLYSNWYATIDSTIPRKRIRNTIDSNDDNHYGDKPSVGLSARSRLW